MTDNPIMGDIRPAQGDDPVRFNIPPGGLNFLAVTCGVCAKIARAKELLGTCQDCRSKAGGKVASHPTPSWTVVPSQSAPTWTAPFASVTEALDLLRARVEALEAAERLRKEIEGSAVGSVTNDDRSDHLGLVDESRHEPWAYQFFLEHSPHGAAKALDYTLREFARRLAIRMQDYTDEPFEDDIGDELRAAIGGRGSDHE